MSDTPPSIRLHLSLPVGPARLTLALSSSAPVIGLTGPSGAGKSTLLRALAGVERGATGEIHVGGVCWQDARTFLPPWERRTGWVPQDALLFPHLDVRQNLSYADPATPPSRIQEIAAMLEVAHLLDRRPRHLSGGERQRVALGRALLSSPRLLLLDEPFASLDRALRDRIGARLAGWLAEQTGAACSALLVSHDPRDMELLRAEGWRLEAGQLDRSG